MGETTKKLPERRITPFKVWVDRDSGAILEDAHGRPVAFFGRHPDGAPATDEAERVVEAFKILDELQQCSPYPDFEDAKGGCYFCGEQGKHDKRCLYRRAQE